MNTDVVESMMYDRGYTEKCVPNDDDSMVESSSLVLICKNRNGKKCFAHWLLENKLGINTLRNILQHHERSGSLGCIIIICPGGATPFTEKKIREMGVSSIVSVFRTIEVKKNITKHCIVPRHRVCSPQEVIELQRRHRIDNMKNFPILFDTDPVAKYYNFLANDVIQIQRCNAQQEVQFYYRVVVPYDHFS